MYPVYRAGGQRCHSKLRYLNPPNSEIKILLPDFLRDGGAPFPKRKKLKTTTEPVTIKSRTQSVQRIPRS